MIARRDGFQRVYDLHERVMPNWDDAKALSRMEASRVLTLNALRALGVARVGWLTKSTGYFGANIRTGDVRSVLAEATREGELIAVKIEGSDEVAYIHRDNRSLMESALDDAAASTITTLLSPFDPVISNRVRAKELFDFDYRIETYTPEAKRRYGYFSLPILHRGNLVGRLDAKAHRRDGLFEVKALHLEDEVSVTDTLLAELAVTLRDCARWHKTPEVIVRHSSPAHFGEALSSAVAEG